MNYFKTLVGGLVLGSSLMMVSGCNFFSETAVKTNPGSEIVLSEVEAGGPDPEFCHIPAVEGRYPFGEVGGCYQDDNDLIMLRNVPSALTITIHDDRGCRIPGNDWRISITTVKNPTTTGRGTGSTIDDFIKFETIWNAPDGSVIVPGVMKESRWSLDGRMPDFTNGASCVSVERI